MIGLYSGARKNTLLYSEIRFRRSVLLGECKSTIFDLWYEAVAKKIIVFVS
jgi:hypothetical protein